ncbi:glycosyltransferase family 8 protein [Aaosphaeria arxii CBS 175.79]|uniref:Glycosyltransferase family 8 protein n=1 Tax=Aaosphaeria arxii CBS 175.79 TaxID=1450172 RepID=A0A6A5XFX6_9PLEO|nr:glycosyltransferase family 8 protein [Aaosphaeria arxii CBS 175.79]KAF2011833.1 glycosyltransferase family 8 protein [Aaosphaeria arxii CBS 175.79]
MALVRRFQSIIIAVLSVFLLLLAFQFLAANVSFALVESGANNASIQLVHPGLRPYVPDHIWWTSETKLEPKFAYAQYATDEAYFCNALINAKRLKEFGATADVVLMYPSDWDAKPSDSVNAKMLTYARSTFPNIYLEPVDRISTSSGDPTWAQSLTKFNAFRLSNYSRVLYFDSDSLVLNSLDHYFLAPLSRLAVPRAYWLNDIDSASIAEQTICSHVMLLQPDQYYYDTIMNETQRSKNFDMEVINSLFKGSAMILPHRRLALLTGEFRTRDHQKYLREEPDAEWNAMAEVSRSVLVHFSDWPLPKPWKPRSQQQWEDAQPACDENDERDKEKEDRPPCADRMMWSGFYETYDMEKQKVCEGKW